MFGFGKKGVTDQEMWTIAIRAAVAATAEEDVSKKVVGADRAADFITRECKSLRLRPTSEQDQHLRLGVQALINTDLTRSLMWKWLDEKRVSIMQVDIIAAGEIFETAVKEFGKTSE